MGPLSGVSCMECHQYIWKQYGVGCACSSGVVTFLWSTSRPCLASVYSCSLPLMYVWAFILWSVMICVRDIYFLLKSSRMSLSTWLLCRVGCLRGV